MLSESSAILFSAISVAISYIISVYCGDYAGYFTVILLFLAFHFYSAYFIYLVSCRRENLEDLQSRHCTRGLRQILHHRVVLGGPCVWIVRSFLECTFWYVCHYFSKRLLNLERKRFVFNFFTLLRGVLHYVVMCPSCYIKVTFQHIHIRRQRITQRWRGSLMLIKFGCH